MNSIRVILADDHPVIRTGIRALLERSSDITIVAEACNGLEALDLVQREALVLTYNDLLLLIGALFIFGLMLLPLVSRPRSFLSR